MTTLRTCKHPGVEKQIADLEGHIAFERGEVRKQWSHPRARLRLVRRLDDATADLDEATNLQKDLAARQKELRKQTEEARDRAAKQQAAVDERRAELEAFDAAASQAGAASSPHT